MKRKKLSTSRKLQFCIHVMKSIFKLNLRIDILKPLSGGSMVLRIIHKATCRLKFPYRNAKLNSNVGICIVSESV